MTVTEWIHEQVNTYWDKTNYLLIVPALILIFSLGVIGNQYLQTGQVLDKGLEFSGGTEITLDSDTSEQTLKDVFETRAVRTLHTDQGTRYTIELSGEHDTTDIKTILQDNNIEYTDLSVRSFGAAVSQTFLTEAVYAIIAAFLIMSLVVFIAFREWVPSVAVILAAATDILFAVAMMITLNIELAFGSLAALLMLIGYSVDTDVMLSTRMLKTRGEDLADQFASAIVTGTTMSLSAATAFTVLYFVSTSPILDQISLVIIWGLLIDILITYCGNAVILKWYIQR